MKEHITVRAITNQTDVHPDAVYGLAASRSLQSTAATDKQGNIEWKQMLRPVDALRLQSRPIGNMALNLTVLNQQAASENPNVEKAIAGSAYLKPEVKGYAEVTTLNVEPAHRGRDIGKLLIRHTTADALLMGDTPTAFAANPQAQKAFLELGYRLAEEGELPPEMTSHNLEARPYVMDAHGEAAAELLLDHFTDAIYDHEEAAADLDGFVEHWRQDA